MTQKSIKYWFLKKDHMVQKRCNNFIMIVSLNFIEYNDNDVIRPLCIKLLQLIARVKCFHGSKTLSFMVSDKELSEKYTKTWKNVSSLIGKKIDTKPVYGGDNKYTKTKIKVYNDKVSTTFQGKEIPKEDILCKCLSLTMLDSAVAVSSSNILRRMQI